MTYLLGIDQGTSQTTAVVIDQHGQLIASRSVRLPTTFPGPGRVEQDPWDILETVQEAAAPLVEEYPIEAVGFDNQGETFVLWEADSGQPATPAIVWQDKRGQAVCETLAKQADNAWLRRKTGLLLDSYFTAPKLRYVLENDATLREAARLGRLRFGTTEAWVIWHLSGGRLHVTDPSTAARTLLFDIYRLEWDAELLDLFGVSSALLPDVHPTSGYVGEINLGGRSLPLHALVVDQQAALFGQACFSVGEMKCSFGTGSFLLMNTGPQPKSSNHGLLTSVAWVTPAQTAYALEGGIFVTGAAVEWLADGLHLLPDVASSAEAALRSTDPELTFVPALAGLAAPHWRPEARGALFGLSRATTPADIARATLEGIAFRVVEIVEAMKQDGEQTPAFLKADGGPAANPYLMQTLADLLGLEVQVAAGREATAVGAANLATLSAWGTTLDELRTRWQAEAVYTPKIGEAERGQRLERWQQAVQAVKQYHAR